MSFMTRLRRPAAPPDADGAGPDDSAGPEEKGPAAVEAGRPRWRTVVAWVLTVLSAAVVLAALVLPNELDLLTVREFLYIPVEALAGAVLLLLLPPRGRRIFALVVGPLLGALVIVKLLDMGFNSILDRPFDLVLDWVLFDDALTVLKGSVGEGGVAATVVGAILLAIAVLVLTTLSVIRLTSVVPRSRGAVAWIACAILGALLVTNAPIATERSAILVYERAGMVRDGLRDRQLFAEEARVDAFRDTPGDRLLTALRGKDVVLAFVESYGRDAVEDPEFAGQVGAVLDAGYGRLRTAGYSAKSGYLTSSTSGGGSWLAHSTFLSGLWIDNQQRFRTVTSSDRLTLVSAFRRAGWRTVGVMPGITRAWPEGDFYGYDQVYDLPNLGYRGPGFGWATMADQYTMLAYERFEHAKTDRGPVFATIPLVSSHSPWAPLPRFIDWNQVGDGSIYHEIRKEGLNAEEVWRDQTRVRTEYRHSIEYTLTVLTSYIETYGDDDLVVIFLGDHQPSPLVAGDDAGHDVPISIVARDPAVMDRIASWGWQDGLRPGPQSPVWPMNSFRDRFLTAYGS
jgi:hypothetical protein